MVATVIAFDCDVNIIVLAHQRELDGCDRFFASDKPRRRLARWHTMLAAFNCDVDINTAGASAAPGMTGT
jgi:hypothetical protein